MQGSGVASEAYDVAASAGNQAYDAAADAVDQVTQVLSNYNSKAKGASKSIADAASSSTQASYSWLKVGCAFCWRQIIRVSVISWATCTEDISSEMDIARPSTRASM